jgi:hypothetical protein
MPRDLHHDQRRTGPSFATVLSALALLALSCTTEPRMSWSLSFANSGTATRTDHVEVQILKGGCDGGTSVYRAEVGRGGSAPVPPNLSRGKYALWGRAVTADCLAVAKGCLEVTLPAQAGTSFQVVLNDVPEEAVCEGSCIETCGGGDGDGDADGKPDASSGDGDGDAPGDGDSPGDGHGDGDGDVSPPDAGGDGDGDPDAGMPDACSDGRLRPGGHCYRFVTEQKLSFADAEADCVDWGGHLVSLNDEAEELWVYQQSLDVSGFASTIRYWIGFTDAATETLWAWTDDTSKDHFAIVTYRLDDPVSLRFKVRDFNDIYTHWGPNLPADGNSEPNNGANSSENPASKQPGEDCAVSRSDRINSPGGITPRAAWDDTSCTETDFYVCER